MEEQLEGVKLLRKKIQDYIREYHDMPYVIVNSNTRKDIEGELAGLFYTKSTHIFGCPIAICETLEDDVVVLR